MPISAQISALTVIVTRVLPDSKIRGSERDLLTRRVQAAIDELLRRSKAVSDERR